jgi:hypothetical protein
MTRMKGIFGVFIGVIGVVLLAVDLWIIGLIFLLISFLIVATVLLEGIKEGMKD